MTINAAYLVVPFIVGSISGGAYFNDRSPGSEQLRIGNRSVLCTYGIMRGALSDAHADISTAQLNGRVMVRDCVLK